jgi:DNA-binding transcriptional MocR family regulator
MPRIDFSSDQPFFQAIVQSLADDIANGRLRDGDRLPPHRDLAQALGVARGTIARAYAQAEGHGLVRGGVGQGTFVQGAGSRDRRYGTLLEPPTVASDLSANLPLVGIDSDPAGALRQLAMRPDRMALLRYQSPLGIRRHRMAGVEWARRHGVEAGYDDVLVCAGAQHAIFVVVAHLLGPGEPLLVEEWSYPGLHAIAETLRIRLVAVDMDRGGLSPEALDRTCRNHGASVLFSMPTAHNPLGTVQSARRRRALVEVARRHNLRIIEDAANQLLVPNCPPPLARWAPERTYLVTSTSKILGAGLRVAFLVTPRGEAEAVGRHVWATQWMVSPFGPEVVSSWIENGVADQTIQRKLREGMRRQQLARRALPGLDVRGAPGTLHIWLPLQGGMTADVVLAEARQHGIAVTPSSAFWMRTTAAPEALRISLGGVSSQDQLVHGLRTLRTILDGSARTSALDPSPTRPPARRATRPRRGQRRRSGRTAH